MHKGRRFILHTPSFYRKIIAINHNKFTMKTFSSILMLFAFLGSNLIAQGTLKDYQTAEKWMRDNVKKKIYKSYINPDWTKNSEAFSYKIKTPKGREFYIVKPSETIKTHAFDHKALAKNLSERLDTNFTPWKLPFNNIKLDSNLHVKFSINDSNYVYNPIANVITYNLNVATSYKESTSPNKAYKALINNYNLFLIKTINNDTVQLTPDGIDKYDYAAALSWYYTRNISTNEKENPYIVCYWSPDSKWLVVPRYDRRKSQLLYLMKTTPEKGYRSEIYAYERPLAGDSVGMNIEYYAFNTETGESAKLGIKPEAPYWEGGINWLENENYVWSVVYSRAFKSVKLVEANAISGKERIILEEKAPKSYIDPMLQECHVLENSHEIIWNSERDGWNHLYLYDYKKGTLKNQVTTGDYFVKNIEYIDTTERKIYFMACGKEQGEDPYYTHLYVVNFDGSALKLLTPENAYHEVEFSPDGKFFVNNFSRVDLPNKSKVYSVKSSVPILSLEEADISELVKMGWKAPEMYKVKGRDGKTNIYGLIYRPYNFDPSKKYPVIDATYSGPHTIRTPKTFGRSIQNEDLSIAQLGFIVVTVDGFGSAYRSKEFHDYSYKNLGDIGGPDHMLAIRTLAQKYPYMDTSRVGIYGHSAGGYDAARALLAYPEFYKVAVSSAGNHDHRIAKAWWPELYMGYPVGKNYDEQSNFTHADNLQGKLLLVHGNMDQNVNPAGSLRLADALIEANKDFDLLLINGCDHGQLYFNKYFIRKRWDYFVKHLLNIEPPKEYKIN